MAGISLSNKTVPVVCLYPLLLSSDVLHAVTYFFAILPLFVRLIHVNIRACNQRRVRCLTFSYIHILDYPAQDKISIKEAVLQIRCICLLPILLTTPRYALY
jgi:hypothetical protein